MQGRAQLLSLLQFALLPLCALLLLSGVDSRQTAAALLLCVLLLFFFGRRMRNKQQMLGLLLFAVVCLALIVGAQSPLLYYPVLMNLAAAAAFAGSPFLGLPLIERIARRQEPDLPPEAIHYCRRLNAFWGFLLIGNACVALILAETATFRAWLLYNGFLSYLLLGAVFLLELLYRNSRKRAFSGRMREEA